MTYVNAAVVCFDSNQDLISIKLKVNVLTIIKFFFFLEPPIFTTYFNFDEIINQMNAKRILNEPISRNELITSLKTFFVVVLKKILFEMHLLFGNPIQYTT